MTADDRAAVVAYANQIAARSSNGSSNDYLFYDSLVSPWPYSNSPACWKYIRTLAGWRDLHGLDPAQKIKDKTRGDEQNEYDSSTAVNPPVAAFVLQRIVAAVLHNTKQGKPTLLSKQQIAELAHTSEHSVGRVLKWQLHSPLPLIRFTRSWRGDQAGRYRFWVNRDPLASAQRGTRRHATAADGNRLCKTL